MPIEYLEEAKTWILTTSKTAYVMGVDETGCLQHLYWGARLPRNADYPRPSLTWQAAFESPRGLAYEEYPAWEGIKYREPAVKASFADGVREVILTYDSHHLLPASPAASIPELVISLKDPDYALQVDLHYRVYEACDLIERFAEIRNNGAKPVTLEQALSAVWSLPRGSGYRLSYLAGKWAGETQLRRTEITEGKFALESRRGLTSHQMNPWFAIDPKERAGEEHGEVWFGALAWSGSWKIVVEQTSLGHLVVSGGINDFDFAWLLEANETFRTPAFVAGYTEGGFGAASRNLHQFQLRHVLPKEHRHKPRKVLYNSWEATYFGVTEEGQAQLAEKAAAIGVELFVVDDGWFGARDNDTAGLGDWYVNREKFPNGLKPLIGKVHALGMEFGIWVEPEMVNPDSDLYRKHPDWVYHFPNRPRTESRNQLILNLSRQDVRDYIFTVLDDLLSSYEISFVKWDANRHFSQPGWPEAPQGRSREIWVRHVQGVYYILDRLRERHPNVVFESCSGGGGRVDLGILQHTDQVWTSDNTDAFDRLRIQEGFSHAYCPKVMMAWVTDSPNFLNQRQLPLAFRFHSAMMGSLGIGGNLNEWSAEDMKLARQKIAEYKEIRQIVQEGRLYRLLSPSEGGLSAFQYVADDKRKAVLFVFLHSQQFGERVPRIRLRGLLPEAVYEVTGTGTDQAPVVLSGKALASIGIEVELTGDFASRLIRVDLKTS